MTEDSAIQTGPSSDVFVSYASQDAAVGNSIVEHLERRRIRCWMAPRDVQPGTVYADAIVRAINEAKAMVLVLSASAMASAHVGREVERAASKRKPIIAFRIDAALLSPELEYFLSNSQWIDVPALGMPAALAKLAEAVGRGVGKYGTGPDGSTAGRDGARNRWIAIAAARCGGYRRDRHWLAFWSSHFWSSSPSGCSGARTGRWRQSGDGTSRLPCCRSST